MKHRLFHDAAIAQVLDDDPLEQVGVTPAYQTPSGYTTTIGPPAQTPRHGVSPRFTRLAPNKRPSRSSSVASRL